MQHWEVDGFNTTEVIEKMENGGWKHVCNCNYGYAEPEKYLELNQKNAKLIACLPDLLNALQELHNYTKNNRFLVGMIKFDYLSYQAEAAIKKAIG